MRGNSGKGYLKRLSQDIVFRAVVLGTLIVTTAVFATRPTYQPRIERGGDNQSHAETSTKIESNGFLGVGPDAWTAIFTGVLTGFTGLLALTAFLQIRYLVRADETARRSADAAKQAAEAAMASNRLSEKSFNAGQRPWIDLEHNGPTDIILNHNVLNISLPSVAKNYGATPAIYVTYGCPWFDATEGSSYIEILDQIVRGVVESAPKNAVHNESIFPGKSVALSRSFSINFTREEIDRQVVTKFINYYIVTSYRNPFSAETYCSATGFCISLINIASYAQERRVIERSGWSVIQLPGAKRVI